MVNRKEKIHGGLGFVLCSVIDFVTEHGQVTNFLLWFLMPSFKWGNPSFLVIFLDSCSWDNIVGFKLNGLSSCLLWFH